MRARVKFSAVQAGMRPRKDGLDATVTLRMSVDDARSLVEVIGHDGTVEIAVARVEAVTP